MKKLVLLAASACLFAVSASAQVRFAPEVGFNISKLHYDFDDFDVEDDWNLDEKSFTGIRAGAVVDICVAKHFTIQPGIFYSRKGGERIFTFFENRPRVTPFTDNVILGNNVIPDRSTIQERVVLSYIEIPLMFQYYFDAGPGRIFIGAGPTFSFGVNGDLHLEVDEPNNGIHIDDEFDLDFGEDGLVKATDIGLMANLGYDFDFGLYVRPFYNWGLSNLSHQDRFDYMDIKTRTFGVGFGWWFGNKN